MRGFIFFSVWCSSLTAYEEIFKNRNFVILICYLKLSKILFSKYLKHYHLFDGTLYLFVTYSGINCFRVTSA